jgi:predicted amidohydrolase
MTRTLRVGGAQMGPIQKAESRETVVARMLALLERARAEGCDLVVYPELALTTFFPRWYAEDIAEMDHWFEREMPNAATRPLFERAKDHGIALCLGYAELAEEDGATHRYNTCILVDKQGALVGKYRKVHLPGHADYDPERKWQHLEKRYFEPGNLGFPVWRALGGNLGMCICNDRRWPETYRVMGLQDVELVMLGYNTPTGNAQSDDEAPELRMFHNHMSMQAGAYQNGTWVVGVAKCGVEDGHELMAGSVIVSPDGVIVAEAGTMEDELIVADCDLDKCQFNKRTIFDFAAHRRPEHYRLIVERTGAKPPEGAP